MYLWNRKVNRRTRLPKINTYTMLTFHETLVLTMKILIIAQDLVSQLEVDSNGYINYIDYINMMMSSG